MNGIIDRMKRVILASESPRRKELMGHLGVEFEILPSEYEEDNTLPLPPHELVEKLSLGKAEWVAERESDAIIISADTLCVLDGKVLGKPKDEEELRDMINSWNNRTVMVYTGLIVMEGNHIVTESDETKITFRELPAEEIEAYLASGEGMDKAGGCAVQDSAASFASRIDGDFYGAIGLPLSRLAVLLKEFGVPLFSKSSS